MAMGRLVQPIGLRCDLANPGFGKMLRAGEELE